MHAAMQFIALYLHDNLGKPSLQFSQSIELVLSIDVDSQAVLAGKDSDGLVNSFCYKIHAASSNQ
jgi:hypothetical protein